MLRKRKRNTKSRNLIKINSILIFLVIQSLKSIQQTILMAKNISNKILVQSVIETVIKKVTIQSTT